MIDLIRDLRLFVLPLLLLLVACEKEDIEGGVISQDSINFVENGTIIRVEKPVITLKEEGDSVRKEIFFFGAKGSVYFETSKSQPGWFRIRNASDGDRHDGGRIVQLPYTDEAGNTSLYEGRVYCLDIKADKNPGKKERNSSFNVFWFDQFNFGAEIKVKQSAHVN